MPVETQVEPEGPEAAGGCKVACATHLLEELVQSKLVIIGGRLALLAASYCRVKVHGYSMAERKEKLN